MRIFRDLEYQYLLGYKAVKVDHLKSISHKSYNLVGIYSEFRDRGVGTKLWYELLELVEQQQQMY